MSARPLHTIARVALLVAMLAIPSTARAQTIAVAGGDHRCALSEEGSVQCEGWLDQRECERPGPLIDIALPERAIAIEASRSLACAITESHAMYCWGWEPPSPTTRWREPECPPRELAPREVVGVRGRVRGLAMEADTLCVLLADATVSCWGVPARALGRGGEMGAPYPHISGPEASSGEDVGRVVRDDGAVLGRVIAVTALAYGGCAIDADHAVWCWGANALPGCTAASPCLTARRIPLAIAADALRCSPGACCAVGPERALECWGAAEPHARELTDAFPDWVDLAVQLGGACIATPTAVECSGSMRIERAHGMWDGFRVRDRSILRLDADLGAMCVTTTGSPICWGTEGVRARGLDGVVPRIARTHRRLEQGERALRARVQPRRCSESVSHDDDPHTALAVRATPRGLRIEISRLLYDCGHAPAIDALLRADGAIELGIADPRPARGLATARCDCLHDLVVFVEGVPAGARDIVLEAGGDPVTARVAP